MIKQFVSLLGLIALSGQLLAGNLPNPAETVAAGLPNICYSENTNPLPDTLDLEDYIDGLQNIVKANNRFVGLLSSDQVYQLPVGLHRNIGGIEYIIVLDNLSIDPMGGWISAYMSLQFPGADEPIGLYTDSVRLTANGIQTAQLKLIKDESIDLGGFELVLSQSETMVEWSCNGYESTTLAGDLVFKNDILKPVGDTTMADTLKGSFNVSFEDVNNVMASINLPDFQINGLPDMVFYPGETAMDFSDFQNPSNLVFPDGYYNATHPVELYDLWRGIYIHSFTVALPDQFTNGSGTTIAAERLMIDNNGITGSLLADSVISLNQGNLGSWQFSLDQVGFSLMKNNFADFQFNGRIVVPISQEDQNFQYEGIVDDENNMSFAVETLDSLKADLWAAQLALTPNSTIIVEKEQQNYYPKAILHGSMSVALNDDVELAAFDFQNMMINSRQPYLTIGSFGLPNGVLAGFPVNISQVDFVNEGSQAGISMVANVNFMSDDEGGFAGSGGFTIWAEKQNNKWQYDYLEMQTVVIDVDQGAFEFYGEANFYQQHEVFGKGFKGMVNARFATGIEVEAALQLGNVDGYRYWYADALMVVPNGITMFPGSAIYGFGGGISYHMSKTEPQGFASVSTAYTATDDGSSPGTSLSGVEYLPDNDMGIGLRARVVFGTHPNPKAMNGSIELGFQFYSGGGLESIRFQGEGVVMDDLNSDPSDANVGAEVDIYYSFTNNELFGTSSVYVNIAGMVKGANNNNRAGTITTYFGQQDWFVYAGTPDDRIALEFIGLMEASSYMMVGTDIPPFPDLPSNVSSLADDNVQSRLQGMIGNGNGFAFGSRFDASTGEKNFTIFFGSFEMGAGFDIMIRDFGASAHCEGSDPPLGINGWYAMGQAYAYLDGKIGIKVKMFGKRKKFTILNVGAAAVLQTALPNPIYLRGAVEGHYSILNGAVKGQCNFEFSVGEMCEIVGGMGDMNIISEISPADGETEVDVFAAPRVAFNYTINQSFELMDTDGDIKEFRILLDEFIVNTGGSPYPGEVVWNDDHNVASFESTELLPSEEEVAVSVTVVLEFKENGEWQPYTFEGEQEREEEEVTFTSGVRPDYIPAHCVEYMYPFDGMVNFYWQEHPTGYIKVTDNFDYLFNDENEWIPKAIFDNNYENMQAVSYDEGNLQVNFDIPQSMTPEMIYELRICKIPSDFEEVAVDEGVVDLETVSDTAYTKTEQDIETTRSLEKDRIFYRCKVRTSKYATLADKIDDWSFSYTIADPISTGTHILLSGGEVDEGFANQEINSIQNPNLVRVSLDLENNYWYTTGVEQVLYHDYPVDQDMVITHRNPVELGVPPAKACEILQNGFSLDVTAGARGMNLNSTVYPATLMYDGVPVMNVDLSNLRDHAADLLSSEPNHPYRQWLTNLLENVFSAVLYNHDYTIKIKYVLPGDIESSETPVTFTL